MDTHTHTQRAYAAYQHVTTQKFVTENCTHQELKMRVHTKHTTKKAMENTRINIGT